MATDDADRVFLETTRRLAPPKLALDDARVALELLRPALGAAARVADLGCGYGRHLAALQQLGLRAMGVDKSALLLREARRLVPEAPLMRADLRGLPIRTGSVDGAACFYSSMFLGSEDDSRAALAESRRVLKRGGLLVLTTDNPLRLAASPSASFAEEVPGLGRVAEESEFDPRARTDVVKRRIEGARTISATFTIRYYLPAELAALARPAGLRLVRLHPDAPLTESTPQLVALLAAD